jgi:hypothetical protein
MNRTDANRFLDLVKADEVRASERTITLALCLTGDLEKPWQFDERPFLNLPTTTARMPMEAT